MYDIVVLMEGTLPFSRFLTEDNLCEGVPHVLHTAYNFLQNIIECYLRGLTIASLVEQPINAWQTTVPDQLNNLLGQRQKV